MTTPTPAAPTRAVTYARKPTSHGIHLFLTLFTFGIWGLVVWLPLVLWRKLGPKRRTVTKYK